MKTLTKSLYFGAIIFILWLTYGMMKSNTYLSSAPYDVEPSILNTSQIDTNKHKEIQRRIDRLKRDSTGVIKFRRVADSMRRVKESKRKKNE